MPEAEASHGPYEWRNNRKDSRARCKDGDGTVNHGASVILQVAIMPTF